MARPQGSRAIDRSFGELGALGLGLSGDRSEHLLYRIERGALARLEPELIVLQVGVDNVNAAGHTASETAAGIEAVVAALLERETQARIVLCGPFPAGELREERSRSLDRVHERIRGLGDDVRVFYRDLRSLFLGSDGEPNSCMAPDRIHITREGQEAWMQALDPLVGDLVGG